jgi:hypothetical protein
MKKFFVVILFVLGLLATTGCSRKTTVPVVVPVHDTLVEHHWQYDTSFVDRWHYITVKGDTVTKTDSVVIFKAKYIHDTVSQSVEVPVEVIKPETVEVEKRLNLWQKVTMWLGNILIFATLGIVGYKLWRKFKLKM